MGFDILITDVDVVWWVPGLTQTCSPCLQRCPGCRGISIQILCQRHLGRSRMACNKLCCARGLLGLILVQGLRPVL